MKRGPKPKRIIKEVWSSNLAYAVGLLATDGCLAKSGHLIDLTSKDKEQLENFTDCLGLSLKICSKNNGRGQESFRVQFRNVFFYKFLLRIGLSPAKSKTLSCLKIPKRYFFDFLRGCFDGDGYSYSYWDKRWKSSFLFYMGFVSASKKFISWIRREIKTRIKISGHLTVVRKQSVYFQLKYAKKESVKLLKYVYPSSAVVCLSRKRLKIEETLSILGERL